MKTAIVLHSISDAMHCIDNKLYDGNMLLSTHSSVDVYLKEEHNLSCQCLSRFISTEEIVNHKKTCSDMVDRLLKRLDHKLSPILNDKFNLKMNYFVPLYSYMGKHQLLGYVCFIEGVRKAIKLLKIDKIYFYDYRFNIFMNAKTDISYIASVFFDGLKTDVIKIPGKGRRPSMLSTKIFNRLNKFFFIGIKILVKRRAEFNNNNFCDGKDTIVIASQLYELEFLKKSLKKYNVFNPVIQNERTPSKLKIDFQDIDFMEGADDPLVKMFLKDIDEDFLSNIENYMKVVNSVKERKRKRGIRLGVWGVSPVWRGTGIIYEYLRSESIKILGAQHGCLFGECLEPWHFDCDFSRCDYFLSYGFTREDLKRLYPTEKVDVEILPVGKVEFATPKKRAKKIDILFPMTNSVSMFITGMVRVPPHELTAIQVALLEHLNSLEGLNIYIKPFAYSNQDNCSTYSLFKRLKNLHVVNDISLPQFLVNYYPRIVVIELPSSPLFDVIHLDTEIFLMGNRIIPYGERALGELARRVHYSENVDDIISKLGLFLDGRLERKRDNTFYNHYVYKEGTKERIVETIESLAGS